MSLIPFAPLYLDRSRNARPLPLRLYRPCRLCHLLHSSFLIETRSLPTLGRCFPSQLYLHQSRQLPWLRCRLPARLKLVRSHLTRRYPRGFAFYVTSSKAPFPIAAFYVSNPIRSIPTSLPVAVCKSSFLTLSMLRATQPLQARIMDQPFLPFPLAGCMGPSR